MNSRKPLSMSQALAASLISASVSIAAFAGPPMVRAPLRMTAPTTAPKPAAAAKTTTRATPQHTTGQPNQTCGSASAPLTPGNAAAAQGSAFNPNGTAGTKYAGQQPQNSGNPKSVAQYDVACSHQK